MPAESLCLSDWEVAETEPGAVADPVGLEAVRHWFAATAPGTVAGARRAAGTWSIDHRDDLDASDWWYRTWFDWPPGRAGRVRLGGLATIADVWVNRTHVVHSENMFHEHEVEVPLATRNEVVIAFRSLGRHLAVRRPRPRWKTRLVEQQQLRWVRTTFSGRMAGWQPVCAPVGPWRAVEVSAVEHGLRVVTCLPMFDDGDGRLRFEATVDGPRPDAAVLDVAGVATPLAVETVGAVHRLRGEVVVAGATPWFPATHGTPALHPVIVRRMVEGAEVVDELPPVGFRRMSVDDSEGRFRLSVNGVDVFCRGVCWVPEPVELAEPADRIETALRRLVAAGANMVRVAGIGVDVDHEFLDLCDRLGLLVWHDLMFANLDQPLDDPEFRSSVDREVRGQLQRFQRHAAVAVVCGGSEVEQQAAMMGVAPDVARNRVGREVLPALAGELLPGIPVVPCSPSGGTFPFHVGTGVSHYYGVGAYLRPLDDARTAGVKFAAECLAFANVPCRETTDELLDRGERPGHSPGWKARVPRDRGAGWDFEDVRDHYVHSCFGVEPRALRTVDPDRYLDVGRAVVCITGDSLAADLRPVGSGCGGTLVFNHRDPWPGAGWGVVDVHGRPKSVFHALARAWAPRALMLRDRGLDGVAMTVFNDQPGALEGVVRVRLFGVEGLQLDAVESRVTVPPHGELEQSVDAMFSHFRDLSAAYRFGPPAVDVVEALLVVDGVVVARAHFLPGGHRRDRRTDLGLQARWDPSAAALRVSAEQFAHFVSIDVEGAVPADNWFHLSPKEERVIALELERPGGPVNGEVRALNGYGVHPVRSEGA